METQTITTKTFKEVHAELDNEHLFLQKNHDIANFKSKADFLSKVGFGNSIATKLYSAVAENHNVVAEYGRKYLGQYKFILRPQLERVCEKYNLFVREPKHFLGDIPEKNIKDIMGFSVFVDDLPIREDMKYKWLENYKHLVRGTNDYFERNLKIPIEHFAEMRIQSFIHIAAIKPLFADEAFAQSQSRILNKTELVAKHQVELDPIVLCETKHGYIIITAWGDEANDELVVNGNLN